MQDASKPIVVDFPLRGEWCAVNTPGYKIPSHGTSQLGQKYAYDFLQIDWSKKGYKFYTKRSLKSFLFGIELSDTYCWSQSIYSSFEGVVVECNDGIKERNPINFFRDLLFIIKNALFLRAKDNHDLRPALGNYIIIKKSSDVFSLIAHLKKGSIRVSNGDHVFEGQKLAEVGHSGNSTGPHLHFQLMNKQELLEAQGLPCCFRAYQVFRDGIWMQTSKMIPGRRERIRY